jgi:flavodoxin I
MEKTGLFYAPAKGSTERVARLIQEKSGNDKIDLILIEDDTDISVLKPYSKIIFGISTVGRDTWDSKYKKVGWDFFIAKLEKADLKNKTIAIFGLGDHILYPNHFVNSMGVLAEIVEKSGAKLVGKTSVEGYTFSDSEAINDGMFMGLPIDEENEHELTEKRLNEWLSNISIYFGF